jgi:hypothetical protein
MASSIAKPRANTGIGATGIQIKINEGSASNYGAQSVEWQVPSETLRTGRTAALKGPDQKECGMNKKLSKFFYRALVSSIVVLVIGFLALGVRAFATEGIAKFVFFAAFLLFVVILGSYFIVRRPTEDRPAAPTIPRFTAQRDSLVTVVTLRTSNTRAAGLMKIHEIPKSASKLS